MKFHNIAVSVEANCLLVNVKHLLLYNYNEATENCLSVHTVHLAASES